MNAPKASQMSMQDIKSLNFEPLRAVYPELANMGGYAEHYAHTDHLLGEQFGMRAVRYEGDDVAKLEPALNMTLRMAVNTTFGLGGLLDVAGEAGLERQSEDFGQTLGVWGWKRSRYVELPFFGPRTVRDVLGLAGDMPLSPTRYVEEDKTRIFLQGLNLVDTRAQLLSLDSLREGAVDDYALVRDSWLQRRNYQIESHRTPQQPSEGELPEYLQDETDPTVPVDAMPMPEINGGG